MISVLILSFIIFTSQFIFLREFYGIFGGNEIIFGIVLANYFLISGIGALLTRGYKIKHLPELLLSITPIFILSSVTVIRLLSTSFKGIEPGLINILLISFSILLPVGIINGFYITWFSKVYDLKKTYIFDSIGSLTGGLIFSFFLIPYLSHLNIIRIFFLLSIIGIIFIWLKNKKQTSLLIGLILIAISIVTLIVPIDINSTQSKYGFITTTTTDNQTNFYQNNKIIGSTDDYSREIIHMPAIYNPNSILIISNGLSGILNEATKYNASITFVQKDKELINLANKYKLIPSSVNIINQDPIHFLKSYKNHYDLTIIDISIPNTIENNRFYTNEFFSMLKGKTNIAMISLPNSENYQSKELINLNANVYNTIKQNFKNIILLPLDKNYYIFSNDFLEQNLTKYLINPRATYYNEYYMDHYFTRDRTQSFISSTINTVHLNTINHPLSLKYSLQLWLSKDLTGLSIIGIILSILIGIFLYSLNSKSFIVFSTALTSIAANIIILFKYQSYFANTFLRISLLTTIFMLGIAIGAIFSQKKQIPVYQILIGFIITLFLLLFILPYAILFYLLSIIIGGLTGLVIPTISSEYSNFYQLFTADFIGASIGALTFSSIIIPLIGIKYTIFALIILNLLNLFIRLKY